MRALLIWILLALRSVEGRTSVFSLTQWFSFPEWGWRAGRAATPEGRPPYSPLYSLPFTLLTKVVSVEPKVW